MDWTLSITLFKQVLMCLMKLHSTTRRWGGGGSILIIKGGGAERERDVNRGTKVAGFCCKASNIAATCSCDEKCLHQAQQFHFVSLRFRPPLLQQAWNKSPLWSRSVWFSDGGGIFGKGVHESAATPFLDARTEGGAFEVLSGAE